jgi:hypothetical protein
MGAEGSGRKSADRAVMTRDAYCTRPRRDIRILASGFFDACPIRQAVL